MAPVKKFAKRLVPSTPLTLTFDADGGVRTLSVRLAFDFNAFALIEGKTGLNMLRGDLFRQLNATNLVVALWAALQLNNPEYSGDEGLEFLGSIVDLSNSADIGTAVKEAFLLCLSKDAREKIQAAEAKADAGSEGSGNPPPTTPTPIA
jgi:hypothetical protein